MTKNTKGWSEERRKAQAERCRAQKPWEHSTGPKTARGKERSSLNAFKHGARCRNLDRVRYLLWLNREFMRISKEELSLLDTNKVKKLMRTSKDFK